MLFKWHQKTNLYIDNDIIGEKILIGSGGAAGNVISKPLTFKKTITQPGVHKISIDLFNHQTKEIVQKTTNLK